MNIWNFHGHIVAADGQGFHRRRLEEAFTPPGYESCEETARPMSQWRDEINRKALARLTAALPAVFPRPALIHAMGRRFTPPLPRLAIDSYWRAHPVRADRLARALARRSGPPPGWTWRLADETEPRKKPRDRGIDDGKQDWLPASFRIPPAPYREQGYTRGPGFCCICGQPVYRLGWHVDLWELGKKSECRLAWRLRNSLGFLDRAGRPCACPQAPARRRCAETGGRLWKTAEVDHRVPLFRVWREHRDMPWPSLLGFWGMPNLRVINRDAHVDKCAEEARFRHATGCSLSSLAGPLTTSKERSA